MKRNFLLSLITTFIFISLFTTTTFAENVKVSWVAPEQSGTPMVWETLIFVSETSGDYDSTKPVSHATLGGAGEVPTEVVVENLLPGKTYYFVAKHFDPVTQISSNVFSDEVSYTVPIPPVHVVTPLPKQYIEGYKMSITITPVE